MENRRQGERDERREELAEWFSVYHEATERIRCGRWSLRKSKKLQKRFEAAALQSR